MDKRKNSKRKLALLRQNLERRERKLKEHRELQERIKKTKKIIFCAVGCIKSSEGPVISSFIILDPPTDLPNNEAC